MECPNFLSVEDRLLDVGFSLDLQQQALSRNSEREQVAYLVSDEVARCQKQPSLLVVVASFGKKEPFLRRRLPPPAWQEFHNNV